MQEMTNMGDNSWVPFEQLQLREYNCEVIVET